MAAYVVVDIEITDPAPYAEYVRQVPAVIAKYGGRYLARGGKTEVLEGEWTPRRLVIVEFPSLERARAWWDSEDYRGPKALRQSASNGNLVVTEGLG